MGYYEKPVNRSDKAGEKRTRHYESKDMELDKAKRADVYEERTDAFAQGSDYIGVDDIDRLRREKLKHETR